MDEIKMYHAYMGSRSSPYFIIYIEKKDFFLLNNKLIIWKLWW